MIFVSRIFRAVGRARLPILTVALTYLVAVTVGAVMVHTNNAFALSTRDRIVGQAQTGSILVNLNQGNRLQAALLDCGGNLLGAISNTISGLAVILPYPIIAYRGWVGGIVSVDGSHVSRFANPAEGAYYLLTLILQLIPYTLAGGAGVNLGLAFLRPRPPYDGEKWLGVPTEALRDVARVYALVVPLFLIASLWEFLAR
jgi:uncharacterized membrane protein SpoIIM required for sporulation